MPEAPAPAIVETKVTPIEKPVEKVESKAPPQAVETKVAETPKEPVIDPKTFKRKVKIDGKETEVTLEQLEKDYQIKSVSDDKMRTATAKEREAQKIMDQIDKDPEAFLQSKYGDKVNEVAERIIARRLEREMETPEQKEARENKEWRAAREAQDAEKQEEEKLTKEQAEKAKWSQSYSTEINEALDSGMIPQTTGAVRRMAYYMEKSLDTDRPLSAKDVLPMVRADFMNELKELTQGMDAKEIVEALGDDLAGKIRKWDMEKIKTPQDNLRKIDQQSSKDTERKKKRISLSQWGRS